MIGLDISEKEYRKIDEISYSLLSGVWRLRHNAVREKDDWSDGTGFGIITEDLLFGDFDKNDYHIYVPIFNSETKLKKACEEIFKYLIRELDRDGKLADHKADISTYISNNEIGYYDNKDPEWVADKIVSDSLANKYWEQFLLAKGKIIITRDFLDKAKRAVHTLQTHEFTSQIFHTNTFGNIDKYSQVKHTFVYQDVKFKCMFDWLIIDHDKKLIRPYDLKTGANHVEKFEDSFFHWRYDIQACLYTIACYSLRKELGLEDYAIDDFKFVYIGRKNVDRPLVWVTNEKVRQGAYFGYWIGDYYYKGIKELIKDYLWYKEDERRLYPQEVYENSGEVVITDKITVNYGESTDKDQQE